MNGHAVFLIKLCTDSLKNRLHLGHVHVPRIINIATSEQLVWRESPILHDLEQFENGFVLERHVVTRTIESRVVLSELSVRFQSMVVLFQRDIALHIFIEDECKS